MQENIAVRASTKNEQIDSNERQIFRLEITDRNSQRNFLEADVSVLPLTSANFDIRPAAIKLFAANGSPIKVSGEMCIKLDLGLKRNFYWPFMLMSRHLLIDLNRNRLIDNVTGHDC